MADLSANSVYLNGTYMPLEEASISPLDRGFLFGDGIYEVIPTHKGKMVGFELHIARLNNGLSAIGIKSPLNSKQWLVILKELLRLNGNGDLSLYIHISRGADQHRQHGFPTGVKPTVFVMCQPMLSYHEQLLAQQAGVHVVSQLDQRWRRCHIKSTSLLGNVLHFQHSKDLHADETLLYNSQGEITEASTCNVFVVINNIVKTPPLDEQILPGITRALTLSLLKKYASFDTVEETLSFESAKDADEVWLTSSSRSICPVLSIDGHAVGNGKIGQKCIEAQSIFNQHKFD